jgi:integrase
MAPGKGLVFHSLRKTLVTALEDAGVSESLAADIVGHEKPHITYGLYSGGVSLATKAEAIERVRYDGGDTYA